MTGPFEATHPGADAATPTSISTFRATTLRQTLIAERGEQSAKFTEHAVELASLNADSSGDVIGRARALAALRMYCARQAIERIDDALVRLRIEKAIGRYGAGRGTVDPTREYPTSLEQRRS